VAPTAARGSGELAVKAAALHARLAGCGSAIVAFSGGADSAYLAWAATRVLGDRALAVTADSPSYPAHQRRLTLQLAGTLGLRHEVIQTDEVSRPEYRANPVNRCYFCKQELYSRLAVMAKERGYAAVLDGTNADDRRDHRPGRQAAREAGVRSPLDDAGLTKAEIRELSRQAGLPTWNLPASACLSSRIPYLDEVTADKLATIDRAEDALRDLGFRVFRVRHHGQIARIELGPDEMRRALDAGMPEAIVTRLKALGYAYVALDLQGYRTGSLNEAIPLRLV
jgi:uncharacterized protein